MSIGVERCLAMGVFAIYGACGLFADVGIGLSDVCSV